MNREYHILVVEDNIGDFVLIEDFIIEQLELPTITHAKSFQEARNFLLVPNFKFNVVLLDLSLPDHSGEQLINDMVSLCQNIPVIVLTGYVNFAFGVKSLSMGIADYLLKEDLNGMALLKSIVYSTERKKISSELEESEKRVRNFAKQLNNVLEEERSRIAREIHDEFGQQLVGLKMALSALKKQKITPEDQETLITTLMAEVNVSIETIRRIANDLRPTLIDKLGLFVALEWLVSEFEKKTGIKSSIEINAKQLKLDNNVEINIFRICQEALTNAAKHANATEVKLKFEEISEQSWVTIIDNGRGMDSSILKHPLSMGLLNMKERSKLINAELTIKSALNTGTTIQLIVKANDQENINS